MGWYMNDDIFYGSSLLIIRISIKHIKSSMEVHQPKIVVEKCHVSQLDEKCKVEFNQPSCWLYSVPNLLVY